MNEQDTVCAIATAAGTGAIAVIRLSGKDAIAICDEVFVSAKKGKKLKDQKANTVHFGNLVDDNSLIDEVLVAVFKAPHSYTGEDTVEISCHGSQYIQQQIITLFINKGARLARAGEFTQRAFLNGKMDLSQAEAVADLIASHNEASKKIALQQMKGGFSNELKKLRDQLLHFTSMIELELDFSEEDVEFADRKEFSRLLNKISELITSLTQSFAVGNVIKNGLPVAIVGEPNVGKSTLLNLLLKEDRAIVSDIPGTTRDTIEDCMVIEGITFRFIDTAGLRNTDDHVESIGIERTHQTIDKAEIVVLMTEGNANAMQLIMNISDILAKGKKLIVVFNKIDLGDCSQVSAFESDYKTVYISAKKQENIKELLDVLVELSGYKNYDSNSIIVTNVRHYEALKKAGDAIQSVVSALEMQIPTDLLSQDVRLALQYLGEITGEISTDEVLGNIFKNFCIGK